MFGSLLLLLCPICADPVVSSPRVVAKLVSPDEHHVAAMARPAPPSEVERLLGRWESSSRQFEERSSAKCEILRRQIASDVNLHAALAVEQFTGRVEAERLKFTFAWSIVDRADACVCLEATPTDETERLFYGSIRLWFDEQTGRADRLQVIDRLGVVRTSWSAEVPETQPAIALVAHVSPNVLTDEGVPPSPVVLAASVPTQVASLENPTASSLTLVSATEADPTDLSDVTPDVAEILSKWESASQSMKRAKVRFTRIEYNLALIVEKRAEGELFYEAPNHMGIFLRSTRITKNEKSHRTDKNGVSFRLEGDRAESWIWTGDAVIYTNDEKKNFEVIPLPHGTDNQSGPPLMSSNGVVPFAFDIRADRIRRQWSLTLDNRSGSTVTLEATPRTARLKQQLSRCLVMLDNRNWTTVAVKYVDATGNLETVCKTEPWQVNPLQFPAEVFHPNLKARGYKLISPTLAK